MNDKPVTPTARPDFATVALCSDLMKLEEDWLRLEHRAQRPNALGELGDLGRTHLLAVYRLQCASLRANLHDNAISFGTAVVVHRQLEAAFHVARRALNGIPEPDSFAPVVTLRGEQVDIHEVPC